MTKTCLKCKTKNTDDRNDCILCHGPLGCDDVTHVYMAAMMGLNYCPSCGENLKRWKPKD